MSSPILRGSAIAICSCVALLMAGCAAPAGSTRPATPVTVAVAPPPPPSVMPVEAEPVAPATQPAGLFAQWTQTPTGAMLAYADKVRPLGQPELAAELNRLGDLVETPAVQMQMAIVLAQTRVPADLARAVGLLQKVIANPSADALPLQPLARTLAARYGEQRRVEDDRDKQAQQLRDSQRRIEQLNDRIEALRAIERSFARPNPAPSAVPAAPKATP